MKDLSSTYERAHKYSPRQVNKYIIQFTIPTNNNIINISGGEYQWVIQT